MQSRWWCSLFSHQPYNVIGDCPHGSWVSSPRLSLSAWHSDLVCGALLATDTAGNLLVVPAVFPYPIYKAIAMCCLHIYMWLNVSIQKLWIFFLFNGFYRMSGYFVFHFRSSVPVESVTQHLDSVFMNMVRKNVRVIFFCSTPLFLLCSMWLEHTRTWILLASCVCQQPLFPVVGPCGVWSFHSVLWTHERSCTESGVATCVQVSRWFWCQWRESSVSSKQICYQKKCLCVVWKTMLILAASGLTEFV